MSGRKGRVRIETSQESPQTYDVGRDEEVTVRTKHEKPEVLSGGGGGSDEFGDIFGTIMGFIFLIVFFFPCVGYGFYVGLQQGSFLRAFGFALFGGFIMAPIIFLFSIFVFIMSIFCSILCFIVGADWPPPWKVTWDADISIVTQTFEGMSRHDGNNRSQKVAEKPPVSQQDKQDKTIKRLLLFFKTQKKYASGGPLLIRGFGEYAVVPVRPIDWMPPDKSEMKYEVALVGSDHFYIFYSDDKGQHWISSSPTAPVLVETSKNWGRREAGPGWIQIGRLGE